MRKFVIALMCLLQSAVCLAGPTGTPSSTPVAASALVVKVGTAIVSGINIVTGANAGYLMLFNAATVPADGAVSPVKCMPVAPNTGILNPWPSPLYLQSGAVLVFSTTGCFTKTASATAFLSGDIQ